MFCSSCRDFCSHFSYFAGHLEPNKTHHYIGSLFVDRKDPESRKKALEGISSNKVEWPLIVFPEGTVGGVTAI